MSEQKNRNRLNSAGLMKLAAFCEQNRERLTKKKLGECARIAQRELNGVINVTVSNIETVMNNLGIEYKKRTLRKHRPESLAITADAVTLALRDAVRSQGSDLSELLSRLNRVENLLVTDIDALLGRLGRIEKMLADEQRARLESLEFSVSNPSCTSGSLFDSER